MLHAGSQTHTAMVECEVYPRLARDYVNDDSHRGRSGQTLPSANTHVHREGNVLRTRSFEDPNSEGRAPSKIIARTRMGC